jgi:hypothetical protein
VAIGVQGAGVRKRLWLIAPASLALAATLSGCVVFQGPIKAKQIGHTNKVKVTFSICNSDDEPGAICPNLGNSNEPGMNTGVGTDERVLLGLRVPKGTRLPKTIRPREENVVGEFARFIDYKRVLNQEAPKARGFKWLGYQSSPVRDDTNPGGDDGGTDPFRYEEASFRLKLGLPRGFTARRFKFRPVVGWHFPTEENPGIVCGPALYDYVADDDGNGERVCIDSPSPKKVRKSIKVKIER